jgi:hypothetical protein
MIPFEGVVAYTGMVVCNGGLTTGRAIFYKESATDRIFFYI